MADPITVLGPLIGMLLSCGFLAVLAWPRKKLVEEIQIGGNPLVGPGRPLEMEWHRLAQRFGGAVKSCLADRCYAESCLVGRCYARRFFKNLRFWTDEHRVVALFGAVVTSTYVRTGKDDTDLSPEDGSVDR
ncbi:Serine/threonine-protein kinase HT1 [Hordeum vulgare]|nr:Serine/threonine-protein kinase HT1 [Hordeum vulgare]